MLKVTFINVDGSKISVNASEGLSLLEIAHDNGINLEGACGGSLACSTCHLILEKKWYDFLDEPTEEEEDMLDLAFSLTETSRLGCQIFMKPELNNIVVKLPPGSCNLFLN